LVSAFSALLGWCGIGAASATRRIDLSTDWLTRPEEILLLFRARTPLPLATQKLRDGKGR
jgi:hypothetical protein